MSVMSLLKRFVPVMLRRMNRNFKVPYKKQKAFLDGIAPPRDLFERTWYQYLGQRLFWGRGYYAAANLCACVLYPAQRLKLRACASVTPAEPVELLLLPQGNAANLFPEELLGDYGSCRECAAMEGMALTRDDADWFRSFARRYRHSPFLLYKCLVKLACYSYLVFRYHPRALAVCGGECTFTAAFLTEYCHHRGVCHINAMHGEMFYYVLDAFSYFDRNYVWDGHYRALLMDLRADAGEFVITQPPGLRLDLNPALTDGVAPCDFTYYLQLQKARELRRIASEMQRLRDVGASVRVRYHPRAANIGELEAIFGADNLENSRAVSLADSLCAARHVVTSYSTVLFQAWKAGCCCVLDDVTCPAEYGKLRERRYIMTEKPDVRLLSEYIK